MTFVHGPRDRLANRLSPEYEDWDQQDSVLVSWLLSSMVYPNPGQYSVPHAPPGFRPPTQGRGTPYVCGNPSNSRGVYSHGWGQYTVWGQKYPDSGATHHLTPHAQNLSRSTDLNCDQQILMGDASSLPIKTIGHTSFLSPIHSQSLTLNNLLYVPLITKNLMSVSQFATDNNVSFEFFLNSCYVKDLATKKILLVGRLDNGLYKFDSLPLQSLCQQLALTHQNNGSSVSYCIPACNTHSLHVHSAQFSLWHNKLGHPTARIVQSALQYCNITISNKTQSGFFDLCVACCLGKTS
uniref:Retrovirus-related Pol polyprotein from transposon TNT 1-94-like beta-barrel domain-containing protein n=1 Tax=Cannabis sativa TaxID=3483 RepID=A0A803Q551_CANSA